MRLQEYAPNPCYECRYSRLEAHKKLKQITKFLKGLHSINEKERNSCLRALDAIALPSQ